MIFCREDFEYDICKQNQQFNFGVAFRYFTAYAIESSIKLYTIFFLMRLLMRIFDESLLLMIEKIPSFEFNTIFDYGNSI